MFVSDPLSVVEQVVFDAARPLLRSLIGCGNARRKGKSLPFLLLLKDFGPLGFPETVFVLLEALDVKTHAWVVRLLNFLVCVYLVLAVLASSTSLLHYRR